MITLISSSRQRMGGESPLFPIFLVAFFLSLHCFFFFAVNTAPRPIKPGNYLSDMWSIFCALLVVVRLRASDDIVYDLKNVQVTINFYDDPECTIKKKPATYQLGDCSSLTGQCDQLCYSWSRTSAGVLHENSASDWFCYRDWGVSYTQWVLNGSCGGPWRDDKIARIGCCVE